MKLEKLRLIAVGELPCYVTRGEVEAAAQFDITKNLRLVPRFNEGDVPHA